MKVIRKSSASEVTMEWLRAELDSERFGEDLRAAVNKSGYDETIITTANLVDNSANKARWTILKSYRTWLDCDFVDYDWDEVELSNDEVANLSYIDYSYWNELSDGTRKVGRAAANVAEGVVVFDVPNDGFFSVAKSVENGTRLPPIIVVNDKDRGTWEILDGHLRATGYILALKAKQPLKAMWGTLRV